MSWKGGREGEGGREVGKVRGWGGGGREGKGGEGREGGWVGGEGGREGGWVGGWGRVREGGRVGGEGGREGELYSLFRCGVFYSELLCGQVQYLLCV